jgi:hypothetical protein
MTISTRCDSDGDSEISGNDEQRQRRGDAPAMKSTDERVKKQLGHKHLPFSTSILMTYRRLFMLQLVMSCAAITIDVLLKAATV